MKFVFVLLEIIKIADFGSADVSRSQGVSRDLSIFWIFFM